MKKALTILLTGLIISTSTAPVQASGLLTPVGTHEVFQPAHVAQVPSPVVPATAVLGEELSDVALNTVEGQIAWVPVLIAGWLGGWTVSICYVFC